MQDLRDSGYDLREHTEIRDSTEAETAATGGGNQAAVGQDAASSQQVGDLPSVGAGDGHDLPHVLLVVAVVSARPERRDAIRETWLAWGDDRVQLRFFTEAPTESDPNFENDSAALQAEADAHGDLVLMDIDPGMNFALKLLWGMRWMSQHFAFDFFLRLDDDYFLCLRRLLDELDGTRAIAAAAAEEDPAPLKILAGHRYCLKGQERFDEAYLLVSEALVVRILSTPDLECGGHAGTTVGWWFTEGQLLNSGGDVQWVTDPRLDHSGDFFEEKGDRGYYADVCATHMGVHHAYPDLMATLWEAAKDKPGPEPNDADSNDSNGNGGVGSLSLLHYVGNTCPENWQQGMSRKYFDKDNPQPCDTFVAKDDKMHCGKEGC